MTVHDLGDPQFVTVLADMDQHCRWVARVRTHDTGEKEFDLLIVLDPDGNVSVATRPWTNPECSWTPPIIANRR